MRDNKGLIVAFLSTDRMADTNGMSPSLFALSALHYFLSSDNNTVMHVAFFMPCRMHKRTR
jgi:hypothetical protein